MVNKYGECRKLSSLPVGTKFLVVNGVWSGKIVDDNGVKSIYIEDNGKTYPLTDEQELVLANIEIPLEEQVIR